MSLNQFIKFSELKDKLTKDELEVISEAYTNYIEACQMLQFIKNKPKDRHKLIEEYEIIVKEIEQEIIDEITINKN